MEEDRKETRDGEPIARPEIRLLADEPSSSDEFDAKAHGNVANAIADLIESEPGGRVIGLEGFWGSGKSTVIELLRKRLSAYRTKGRSTVHPIIFDAWAHQGDPLRRTFLEKLIDELSPKGASWLSGSEAKDFRTELSGRVSQVHTTTTGRLSAEGRWASGAAILIPLGAVLLANEFQSHHRTAQIVGLLLMLAPLLVVAAFLATKGLAILTGGKEKKAGRHRRLADMHAFSFFANEQDTDTTTEGIERGEPTSVEFERLFSDILETALTDERRVLIVLDNLDRVEESDAKTVLATMQTFTGSASLRSAAWAPSVWTLIPYDPVGLDRLWHELNQGANDEGAEPSKEDALSAPTAAAFVEKVFQIRFEAPPLVLSDWRGYLKSQLALAMPGENASEFDAVLRLRALYPGVAPNRLVAQEAPTPRQLKQFVNQIGSIRRLRDDIPLVHVAYYVLLKKDRVDVAKQLVAEKNPLPHAKLTHLLNESVQDDLAALHFGAPPALAQQLVLGSALEQAFASGEASRVEQLKDRSGFVDALESLDLGSRGVDGGVELTRAVAVLKEGGALDISPVSDWAKDVLEPIARKSETWALAGRETGVGLATLLSGLTSGNDDALTEQLKKVESATGSADADGHLQLDGLAGLGDELLADGRPLAALRVRLDLPDDRFVESVAYFGSQTTNEQTRAVLELGAAPDAVSNSLATAATSDGHASATRCLSVLMKRPERIDLRVLVDRCVEWLRNQDVSGPDQLDTLTSIIDVARKSLPVEEIVGPAADDGTLMHQLSLADRSGWHAATGAVAMLQLLVRPTLPEPQANREAANGTQILREVLTNPAGRPELTAAQLEWLKARSREAVALILSIAKDKSFRPWVDEQLRSLAAASSLPVTASQYKKHWKFFRNVLGEEEYAKLSERLLGKQGSREQILKGSTDPTFAISALATAESERGKSYAKEVRTWAGGIVKEAPQEAWQAALGSLDGGPMLNLALELAGTKEAPSNPTGLADELHTHSRALAADEPAWRPDGETFKRIVGLLGAPARNVLASQLCAELEGRDGQVGAALFTTYGPFLAGEKAFRTHAKFPNFVERLVAHDQWDAVQWVADVAEHHSDTLQVDGREPEVAHLANRVKEKLAESGDDQEPPAALRKLADLLPEVKA